MEHSMVLPIVLFSGLLMTSLGFTYSWACYENARTVKLVIIAIFFAISTCLLQTIIGINQPYVWVGIIFFLGCIHALVYMLTGAKVLKALDLE